MKYRWVYTEVVAEVHVIVVFLFILPFLPYPVKPRKTDS
jgi:hypothetical protein